MLGIALSAACARKPDTTRRAPDVASLTGEFPGGIRTYSTLQALMEEGNTGPHVSLATLKPDKALIGIGSLSELRGEIWIYGGEVWLGYPKDDKSAWARELGVLNESAAFAATARVTEWQTGPVSRDVPFEELADFVEGLARGAGLDLKGPIPIAVEGKFTNLALNVVDGRGFPPGKKIPRDALMAAAAKAEYASVEGVIVGFFARGERPELIHPGARLHLHVLLRGENQVGHVDRVTLTPASQVRLPVAGTM